MPGIEMLSSKGLIVLVVSIFAQSIINPAFILFLILINILFWFLRSKNRNTLKRLFVLLISVFSPFLISYLLESMVIMLLKN